MTFATTFRISAKWQGRPETPPRIAQRIKLFIAYSKVALPTDTRWYRWLQPDCLFDIEQEPEKLESCVAERICTKDDGEPAPIWVTISISRVCAVTRLIAMSSPS